MAEYRYVSLPTAGKQVRSEHVADYASAELNEICADGGWEVVSATRPAPIGPIGFLLKRD
jgi:hypothetical protein